MSPNSTRIKKLTTLSMYGMVWWMHILLQAVSEFIAVSSWFPISQFFLSLPELTGKYIMDSTCSSLAGPLGEEITGSLNLKEKSALLQTMGGRISLLIPVNLVFACSPASDSTSCLHCGPCGAEPSNLCVSLDFHFVKKSPKADYFIKH